MVDQLNSEFTIANLLPKNHYTRKNLGYLYAIKNGADAIIDTDDDNFPDPIEWRKLLKSDFLIKEHTSS